MELVSMELKRSGAMCSRTLGFRDTHFSIDRLPLSESDARRWNECVELWEMVLVLFKSLSSSSPENSARVTRFLWAAHQRFFTQLLLVVKIQPCVDLVRALVAQDHSVIISIISTGGAYTPADAPDVEDEDDSDVVFQSALKEIVLSVLNFAQKTSPAVGVAPLKQKLATLDLDHNSLDLLVDRLGGVLAVSEITGRTVRTVRNVKTGQLHRVNRAPDATLKETRRFMAGQTRIAIISSAGSHGISLHADRGCANLQKRVHVMLQIPWSATVALQQFGRSHRSNQVVPPDYRLLVTELGGEYRLASAIANQLRELGAVTSADRNATAHLAPLDQTFALTPALADKAATALCRAVAAALQAPASAQGVPGSNQDLFAQLLTPAALQQLSGGSKLVSLTALLQIKNFTQFLNRVLGLRVADQGLMFQYFMAAYKDATDRARQEGTLDVGVSLLVGVQEGNDQRWFQKGNDITCCTKIRVDRGVSWDRAQTILGNSQQYARDGMNGYYMSRESNVILVIRKFNVTTSSGQRIFTMIRPNRGPCQTLEEIDISYLTRVNNKMAERLWTTQFADAFHEAAGGRISVRYLLYGLIFPLFAELNRFCHQQAQLRICRAKLLKSFDDIAHTDDLSMVHEVTTGPEDSLPTSKITPEAQTRTGILLPNPRIAEQIRQHLLQLAMEQEKLLANPVPTPPAAAGQPAAPAPAQGQPGLPAALHPLLSQIRMFSNETSRPMPQLGSNIILPPYLAPPSTPSLSGAPNGAPPGTNPLLTNPALQLLVPMYRSTAAEISPILPALLPAPPRRTATPSSPAPAPIFPKATPIFIDLDDDEDEKNDHDEEEVEQDHLELNFV